MAHQTTVYLVDDDAGDRHYLAFRLGAMGIEAWPFASAESFLANVDGLRPQLLLFAIEGAPQWGSSTSCRSRWTRRSW
jgi:FixJ family two-component response regulator